jgi:Domain of unknown function (DUF4062)
MTPTETKTEAKGPTIMVSSCVYGIEDLLEQVFAILSGAGFTVWMSHKGTIPVDSGNQTFVDCLNAVERCDYFLGILTTRYGSGVDKKTEDPSITHRELIRALQLNKPRWFLAHHDLVLLRRVLNDLGYKDAPKRKELTLVHKGVTDDLRVVDMYDAVIQAEKELKDRVGNWAQPYVTREDANIFVVAQFLRFGEAADFVEHIGSKAGNAPASQGGGL